MSPKFRPMYLVHSLLLQMIMLPLVLTILMLFIGPLLSASTQDHKMRLIQLGAGILLPALIGVLAGMMFSRISLKPASPAGRYIPVLLPLLYAVVFAGYALYFSNGNYNSSYWGIYVWKNPIYLVIDLLLSLSGTGFLIPVVELSAGAGFLIGFTIKDGRGGSSPAEAGVSYVKGIAHLFAIAVVALLIAVNGNLVSSGWIEIRHGKGAGLQELTEYDLDRKAPFRIGNGLATLDKKASLQFDTLDDLPRLDGATALYPVYAAFAENVYQGLGSYYRRETETEDRPGLFVRYDEPPYSIIKCSKTPEAYENLIYGKADMIFVAEPSKAHVEQIRSRGDDFVLTPIGSEAFVFFTNKKNPVEGLSVAQIRDIYTGRLTNWKNVGGRDAKILAYQRPENSGSQTTMQQKVMQGETMQEPTAITYAGGMGEVIRQVADYQNAENALGYTFMYYSSAMIGDNRIKHLKVDGVEPRPETVRNGEYPFTSHFYAVTRKSETNPKVAQLLEWIASEEGQSLVEKTGYVPLR